MERTRLHCITSMEKDLIVQGISLLGLMDYRSSTLGNHDITSRVPRHHAWGTKWRTSFKYSHNKR